MTIKFERGSLCRGDIVAELAMVVAHVSRRYGPVDRWDHVDREFKSPLRLPFWGGRAHSYSNGQASDMNVRALNRWTGREQCPSVQVLQSHVKGRGADIQLGKHGRVNTLRAGEKVYIGPNGVVKHIKQAYLIATGT